LLLFCLALHFARFKKARSEEYNTITAMPLPPPTPPTLPTVPYRRSLQATRKKYKLCHDNGKEEWQEKLPSTLSTKQG
jgi:hypothetical protein